MTQSTLTVRRPSIKTAAAALVAALALASCTPDGGYPPSGNPEGEAVSIAIAPATGNLSSPAAATRAGYHGSSTPDLKGDPLDYKISWIRVLLYDPASKELKYEMTPVEITDSSKPVTITLKTGTYDAVFIANEKSSTSTDTQFFTSFFATKSNYDHLEELRQVLIESAAYDDDKDIPMLGIESNVSIDNHHTVTVGGVQRDTRTLPWAPALTRSGARISLEITFEAWQFDEWRLGDGSGYVYLNKAADRSYLQGSGKVDASDGRETSRRSYRAVAAANPAAPAPVAGAEGYYWPVYNEIGGTSTIEKYIVRYDRMIIPELVFEDKANKDKAMVLSMSMSGAELKATVSAPTPESSEWGYTIPRNKWLHLDATVSNSALKIIPMVMNWNTLALDDVLFDGQYSLSTNQEDFAFLPRTDANSYVLSVTTDWPGNVEIINNTDFITHTPYESNPTDGVYNFVLSPSSYNATASSRDGVITIVAGDLQKTIRVGQLGSQDDSAPTKVTTYVGAFWKANQTGERLIRIPRETSGAIDGLWSATVIAGDDWISLDRMLTDDPGVGWIPGAAENTMANGNDPGFDTRYAVHGGTKHVEGTVSSTDLDGIYFRIGLKSKHNIAESPARYGVVLLSYTSSTAPTHRLQRIWIRQGEGDDWLMKPGDPSDPSASLSSRPKAMKFSPYNLTAREYRDGTSSAPYIEVYPHPGTSREEDSAVFVDYPSQGGAYFQWAAYKKENGVSTTEPRVWAAAPSGHISLIADWSGMSTSDYPQNPWTEIEASYESCPEGYRRPTDGRTDNVAIVPVNIVDSEMHQSLFYNPLPSGTGGNVDNSIYGFYADGYFDRRKPDTQSADNNSVANTATAIDTSTVAYVGRLFYNPRSNNSLFFPMAGRRGLAIGHLSHTGYDGSYLSSSSQIVGWALVLTKNNAERSSYNRPYAISLRCVRII